jgi:hypothetical protein
MARDATEPVTPLPVLEMIAEVPTIKAHNIWQTSGDETRRKAAIEFVVRLAHSNRSSTVPLHWTI